VTVLVDVKPDRHLDILIDVDKDLDFFVIGDKLQKKRGLIIMTGPKAAPGDFNKVDVSILSYKMNQLKKRRGH